MGTGLLVSLLVVSTSGAATAAKTTTTMPAPLIPLPRSGHWTVLEIGDSLGTDLGGGLATELSRSPRVHLVLKGKSETGLANAWFYNWPRHLKAFLAEYHPQLTIVLLGGNDEQGMEVNGHAAAFDTPAWIAQYRKNVRSMMDDAIGAGSAVLWVGMPIMYPNGYRQGMRVINSIFAAAAAATPHVTFLSTWDYFANAKGQFQFNARVDGVQQAIREADGIHPTVTGQELMATYIVDHLRSIYHWPVTPAEPVIYTK